MRRLLKPLILIGIGGITWIFIELLWDGDTHWAMFLVGGLCAYAVGAVNEFIPWEMPIWQQALIGATVGTGIEFVAGCILNLWLGLDVWDYSNLPFNLLGQICLYFYFIWIVLSMGWIFIDDWLRYWLWKEERPRYKLF